MTFKHDRLLEQVMHYDILDVLLDGTVKNGVNPVDTVL